MRQGGDRHPTFLRSPWADPGNIETLRRMWGNAPAREIAEAVGGTRNGVIAKANRLGLVRLENPAGKPPAREPYQRRAEKPVAPKPAPAEPRRRGGQPGAQNISAIRMRQASRAADATRKHRPLGKGAGDFAFGAKKRRHQVEAAPLPLFDEPAGVSFADLPARGCMWPVREVGGEHLFCGCAAQSGRPYCEAHLARAYIARPVNIEGLAEVVK
jgi:GcrA cell cycle regulator